MTQTNNDEPLTVERLQEVLKKYDMIIRPMALIVSPRVKKALLEEEPMIEKQIVLVEDSACEDTIAYLISRKDAEKWSLGGKVE